MYPCSVFPTYFMLYSFSLFFRCTTFFIFPFFLYSLITQSSNIPSMITTFKLAYYSLIHTLSLCPYLRTLNQCCISFSDSYIVFVMHICFIRMSISTRNWNYYFTQSIIHICPTYMTFCVFKSSCILYISLFCKNLLFSFF